MYKQLETHLTFIFFCPKIINVHFRLEFYHGSKHYGSRLIWVYINCNIGYIRTQADGRSRPQVVTGGKQINGEKETFSHIVQAFSKI